MYGIGTFQVKSADSGTFRPIPLPDASESGENLQYWPSIWGPLDMSEHTEMCRKVHPHGVLILNDCCKVLMWQ